MARIDLTKAFYFLDGLSDKKLSKEIIGVINSLIITENLYSSATREITTKLENLNEEFKHVKDRNPIHIVKARVKTPKSIIRKLS
jgi:putative GTP pyrophosphokinase